MPESINISRLETRSHDAPDERRTPKLTDVDIVRLHDCTLGRFRLQPGWRWSECIKPVVGTSSCELSHMGHAIKGRLRVQMNDGSEASLEPGMSYTIPPGHDAWVEGDEPFVAIEVLSAEQFAKAKG